MTKYTVIPFFSLFLTALCIAKGSCHGCDPKKNDPFAIRVNIRAPLHKSELEAFWRSHLKRTCRNNPDDESCPCPDAVGCKDILPTPACGSCGKPPKTKVDTIDAEEETKDAANPDVTVDTQMPEDDTVAITVTTEANKLQRRIWPSTFSTLKGSVDDVMRRVKEILSSVFGLTNTIKIKQDETKKRIDCDITISPATSHTENIPLFLEFMQEELEVVAKDVKAIFCRAKNK